MTTLPNAPIPEVDPLVGTAPARPLSRVAAATIDIALVLVLAAAAVIALAAGVALLGGILVVATALVAGALVRSLARAGRTPGHAAMGTRTVRRSTGAATGRALLPALARRDLDTFDLRRGRDPFAPALAPFAFPDRAALPPARPARGRVPVIELDSGQRVSLASALVLGRNPSAPVDAPAEVYQWPDLSRSLSKSHARLEWDGRRVWVTDLGSTNGTFLRTDAGSQPFLAFQRTPVPADATLELGDRELSVRTES